MFRSALVGGAALVVCACVSRPQSWDFAVQPCVATESISFSGLGSDASASPSGRYVAVGDRLIDLEVARADLTGAGISRLGSFERSVFDDDEVLITTRGGSIVRYRWDGGWETRERFPDSSEVVGTLSLRSVGPFDLQRVDGETRVAIFGAADDGLAGHRLRSGVLEAEAAIAESDIPFAYGEEVLASDEFVIVRGKLAPEELARVRDRHVVLQTKPSDICVSGFVSCSRTAPGFEVLIALGPQLVALESPTAAMSAFGRAGVSHIEAVNARGDLIASRRDRDGGTTLVHIANDGAATTLARYVSHSSDVALADSGRVAILLTAGHSGEKRLVIADVIAGCGV